MTNVKLKLMFYILNALLTDIIHARPYSLNSTDSIVTYYTKNDTYLPVESNSDTLIVVNEDETPSDETAEETNKSSNTQMEAIVNAEQDRDEALSEKVIKDQSGVLEMPKNDAVALEQQRNVSSSLLEDIIDSETDREETLTDILHQSEFVGESPRFEFLIAAKVNESELSNKSRISDNSLDKLDRNSSDVLKKFEYVELVEVLKAGNENKSAYYLVNMTSHEVDNDLAPDTRFSDLQTWFLACSTTLLTLLVGLLGFILIRCMCRRWGPGCSGKGRGSSASTSSSDKEDIQDQLKTPLKEAPDAADVVINGDTPPSNGSIFTMTLKNNHLIVETEERNDITKNGRETKMKYSPDSDGIFVVEVQQSNAYRPNNVALQNSPPRDPEIATNQALIHRIPEELDTQEDEVRTFDKIRALSNTGLSISDLSMSSNESHNANYSYGCQMGYEQGPFGYPVYAGYEISNEDAGNGIVHDSSIEPLLGKTPTDPDRPVVTAAIFKQDSIIANEMLQGPVYCIEGSSDGPLLSDVQAREVSLQNFHDAKEKKLENGIIVAEKVESPKKVISRADSLPVSLQDEDDKPFEPVNNMETIVEDEIPKEVILRGKRASLPIIRTEMYESVCDAFLPTESPRFEKFNKETSPCESGFDGPPMITITEETEPNKSDSPS